MLEHLLENNYKITNDYLAESTGSIIVEFDNCEESIELNLEKELNYHIKCIKEDNEDYFEFDDEESIEYIKTEYLQELEHCLELLKKEGK